MKRTLALLLFLMAIRPLPAATPFPVATDGEPSAVIAVPAEPSSTTLYAAEEFQNYIRLITGAELPIVPEDEIDDGQPTILVGSTAESPRLKEISDSFADHIAFGATDGYAIRRRGNLMAIYGTVAKGALNGIYDTLYRNTDIIFARPDPEFGTILNETPTVAIRDYDFASVPAFAKRGAMFNSTANLEQDFPHELFLVRNLGNVNSGYTMPDRKREGDPEWRIKAGLNLEFNEGHNLMQFIPEDKYFDEHPDFYIFKDGRRRRPSEFGFLLTQICFTNEEMSEVFSENLLQTIRDNPSFDMFSVMIEDNRFLCECDECMKPIELPDGTVVEPNDEAFRSTQFFLFLNKQARAVAQEFPGKRIHTFAYFFTVVPPKIDVEPNIFIQYCPLGSRNDRPIYAPVNGYYYKPLLGWMERKVGIRWREYYGLNAAYPRPIAERVAADYQFLRKYGNVDIYNETPPDNLTTWYVDQRIHWDASSMDLWLMFRLAWNPELDIAAERREYIRRVYGPAAPFMTEYYDLLRNSYLETDPPCHWYQNAYCAWAGAVYYKGLEDTCRALLEQAAAAITNPVQTKFLASNRKLFEGAMEMARKGDIAATRTFEKPQFTPLFDSAPWTTAQCIQDEFYKIRSIQVSENRYANKAAEQTSVRILYDDENLYFGIFCQDGSPDSLYSSPEKSENGKTFPGGDCFKIYLATPMTKGNDNACFAFNFEGLQYERLLSNASWKKPWSVEAKKHEQGWSALVTIPWSSLGVDSPGSLETPLRINLYRNISRNAPRTTYVSLCGATDWVRMEYGRLNLK